jgi:enterobacterial common antigen flippase
MIQEKPETSHSEIIKATGLLGGAQIIEILMKIGRNKIIAVLLGPLGVGLIGLYQSIIDLIRSSTGFGLRSSAVRDIAAAARDENHNRIAKTILILKRWVWFTGLLGMTVTFAFSTPLSRYAFGDEVYSSSIKLLSVVLLIFAIAEGRMALLQGLRRIGTMAQAKVWGVVLAFFLTIPLYWLFGTAGIVPAIMLTYLCMLILAVYYARKIKYEKVKLSLKDTFTGGLGMVRLGFFLVLAGLSNTAAMYIVRGFIANKSGISGVGQFQAAWNLSSIYLSAVLHAMASDYFPRLSAVNDDNKKVTRLVNEQTEIALLVSGPLVVGMLTFVNLIIRVLYTQEFLDTVSILHWQLSGTLLKVVAWPLGFIILAKGLGGIFLLMEILSKIFYIIPIYFFWNIADIEITGIAYILAYILYLLMVYSFSRLLCEFCWSKENKKLISIFSLLTILAFFSSKILSGLFGLVSGCLLLVFASTYSYLKLRELVDLKSLFRGLLKRKK